MEKPKKQPIMGDEFEEDFVEDEESFDFSGKE